MSARIVTLASEKGGVAKTTTLMSLAAVTAESSRVLVVDADRRSTATDWAEDCGDKLPFDFAHDTSPENLARVRELDDYDVIYVDTPGAADAPDRIEAIIAASDYVVLPTSTSLLDVRGTCRTVETLLRPRGIPHRVLFANIDTRYVGDVEDGKVLLNRMEIPCFAAFARRYKAHQQVVIDGMVITQSRDQAAAKACDDYRRIALELYADWSRKVSIEPAPLAAAGVI